ncbi:MAG: transcriptional repressor [Myxococcota bacterium]|jgi:Fur family ferric uptake transcriptional regulator
MTAERQRLLQVICDTKGHFKPDELVRKARESGIKLSTATIYRSLSLLVEAGIIRRTGIQDDTSRGGAFYEHIWGRAHHDHLVCVKCGKRVEFFYPAIDVLQEAAAKEHGFMLLRHHLELMGLCPECSNEGKKELS